MGETPKPPAQPVVAQIPNLTTHRRDHPPATIVASGGNSVQQSYPTYPGQGFPFKRFRSIACTINACDTSTRAYIHAYTRASLWRRERDGGDVRAGARVGRAWGLRR